MSRNTSTSSDNCHSENESVPIVDSFKCSKTHCIFCAKEVPPAFVIERGKLMRIKEEMELNSFGCDNFILAKQLRAVNIMRNILDISEETCWKILVQFDGQFNPEFWVKVCASCKVCVEEYNTARREIARLEKKAKHLKEKLKGFILTSNQNEELDGNSHVWRVIRGEALAGFQQPPQNDPQVDIHMEVEVEPEFCVKTEIHEEPRSLAREKRSPTQKANDGMGKKVRVGKNSKPGRTLQNSTTTVKYTTKAVANGNEGGGLKTVNRHLEKDDSANSEDDNMSSIDDIISQKDETPCTPDDRGSLPQSKENLSSRTINDIPSKVLDLILSNVEEIIDIYNCRLVCHKWNDSMRRVLEQKVLSITTIWNTKEFTAYSPLIPNLKLSGIYKKERDYDGTLLVPRLFATHLGNPFPTNSVKFRRDLVSGSEYRFGVQNIVQFFGKFGHHLTCFVWDGYYTSPQRFCELLAKLPNLKTLTLAGISFETTEGEAFDRNSCLLPSLSHLTHLRFNPIGTTFGDKFGVPTVPYFLWILEKYGDQLIGLSVEGTLFKDNFSDIFSEQEIKFTNLKQLKISPMNKSVFQLLQSAPLTHIMITTLGFGYGTEVKMVELYAQIDRFSETLVYLRIPTDNFDAEVGRTIFPCLKNLSIRYPQNEVDVYNVKNYILPKFPVVEHLEFIFNTDLNTGKTSKRSTNNRKSLKIWKDCQYLKKVSLIEIELPIWNFMKNMNKYGLSTIKSLL